MKIYGIFDSTREYGDAHALAITETGVLIATHVSSSEYWAAHDLGMVDGSTRKHEFYDRQFPAGWEAEFVYMRDGRDGHAGLQSALRLCGGDSFRVG